MEIIAQHMVIFILISVCITGWRHWLLELTKTEKKKKN